MKCVVKRTNGIVSNGKGAMSRVQRIRFTMEATRALLRRARLPVRAIPKKMRSLSMMKRTENQNTNIMRKREASQRSARWKWRRSPRAKARRAGMLTIAALIASLHLTARAHLKRERFQLRSPKGQGPAMLSMTVRKAEEVAVVAVAVAMPVSHQVLQVREAQRLLNLMKMIISLRRKAKNLNSKSQ